ncbi:MAG: LPS export ABC transporter periplasmic protein LptC [Nitrospinae bacterium]|nr:LPS export ABC transporter periplasmic protein LptC [Nitrospinota bacterium]
MVDIKKARWILLFIGLSLIILITLFLFKNYKTNQLIIEESDNSDNIESGVDLKIKNFYLMEEKKGHKEWELDAISAESIHSQDITNLKNVKMTFFSMDGGPLYLVADKGRIYNKDIEIYGNVSIFSKKGYLLNTNNLKWISSKGEIKTDDFVEITGPNFRITGDGLISNLDMEDVEIKRGVNATIYSY